MKCDVARNWNSRSEIDFDEAGFSPSTLISTKGLGHIDRSLKKRNSRAVRRKAAVDKTQRNNRQAFGKIEMSAKGQ
jgi:hypothetical protein